MGVAIAALARSGGLGVKVEHGLLERDALGQLCGEITVGRSEDVVRLEGGDETNLGRLLPDPGYTAPGNRPPRYIVWSRVSSKRPVTINSYMASSSAEVSSAACPFASINADSAPMRPSATRPQPRRVWGGHGRTQRPPPAGPPSPPHTSVRG